MRIDEITQTKGQFVDNLRDPSIAELKRLNREIKETRWGILGRYFSYGVKTAQIDGTKDNRRMAKVEWDLRRVPERMYRKIMSFDAHTGRFYKHNLQNWTLKGWTSQNDVVEFELHEKP